MMEFRDLGSPLFYFNEVMMRPIAVLLFRCLPLSTLGQAPASQTPSLLPLAALQARATVGDTDAEFDSAGATTKTPVTAALNLPVTPIFGPPYERIIRRNASNPRLLLPALRLHHEHHAEPLPILFHRH